MENDVKPINNEETGNRIMKFFNEADVKLRGQRGIIVNCLKSDAEAANLWNGMSRAVKLNKVSLFDKVVADLNKYYNGRYKVKAEKCIKSCIYNLCRILTVLASFVIMCLLALQPLCKTFIFLSWCD